MRFNDDEGIWNFALKLIFQANHYSLADTRVPLNNFLDSASVKSVACYVENVVYSSFDVEVASVIDDAFVSNHIVAWVLSQILVDISLVVAPNSHSVRRR